MTHLDIWNTSYGQKKGRESKWQSDSWPLKVRNRPNFLVWMWCETCHWKVFDKGYNFAVDLITIGGLHTKLWGPKITGVPTLGISELHFGSPGKKCHLDVGLVERRIIYDKKEGGGFPQVWAVVSLLVWVCPWFVLTPKVLKLCIDQLVVWFVQICMSD